MRANGERGMTEGIYICWRLWEIAFTWRQRLRGVSRLSPQFAVPRSFGIVNEDTLSATRGAFRARLLQTALDLGLCARLD